MIQDSVPDPDPRLMRSRSLYICGIFSIFRTNSVHWDCFTSKPSCATRKATGKAELNPDFARTWPADPADLRSGSSPFPGSAGPGAAYDPSVLTSVPLTWWPVDIKTMVTLQIVSRKLLPPWAPFKYISVHTPYLSGTLSSTVLRSFDPGFEVLEGTFLWLLLVYVSSFLTVLGDPRVWPDLAAKFKLLNGPPAETRTPKPIWG